ncbi:MAG: LamG domain-containing protein [Candidatus ainarchaeum sp.]|nr:LamG domain-containing protein [Candidatus ainarchaeum sp.]
MLFKKSISPLIATILLIVVSVILVSIVLIWGTEFTRKQTNLTNNVINFTESEFSESIWFDKIIGNKLFVKNLSDQNVTVVAYTFLLSNNKLNKYYENNYIYFNDSIIIKPNSIIDIPIECFPDYEFTLMLLTDDSKYIKLKITNKLNLNDYFNCGLYGSWLFNEDSGVISYDGSKHSNNGTLINNVLRISTEQRESVIDINNLLNNSYVNITFPELFLDIKNNDFTIAFWLNSRDLNVYSNWIRIIDITKDSTNYVQFVVPATNKIQFLVRDSEDYLAAVINTSTTLNINTWYFVTGVYDSKTNIVKIYINGVNKSSVGGTAAISGANNSFNIGRRSNNAGYYNGLISDLRIYDRVLDDQEIVDLYEFTK